MLEKTKTYMVLNYDTSPIAITTRNQNELIPAGNDDEPAMLPLTIDEIVYINSTTKVFKIGRLWFEPEYEADIYEELRINNWKDILRNRDIYDIILNPTVEKLEKVLAITDRMYFDRIYGAFTGLSNAGASVSANVESMLKARYKELLNHKTKTEIKVRPHEEPASDNRVEELQSQLDAMKAMLEKLTAAQNTTAKSTDPVVKEEPKPAPRKRSSSSTKSTAKAE